MKNVTGTRLAHGRAGDLRLNMAVVRTSQKLPEFYMPVCRRAHRDGSVKASFRPQRAATLAQGWRFVTPWNLAALAALAARWFEQRLMNRIAAYTGLHVSCRLSRWYRPGSRAPA